MAVGAIINNIHVECITCGAGVEGPLFAVFRPSVGTCQQKTETAVKQ